MNLELLAERPLLGFPGAVAQLWELQDGRYHITVGGQSWTTADRKEASDRYLHPFCYGFDYQPIPELENSE